MNEQIKPLSQLSIKTKARILNIEGGHGFKRKLSTMGIRKNQDIKIMSRQPFRGPLTIEVCGSQMTLGHGMAQKILVEIIQ